ncbi:MAG: hypothetical protein V2A34_11650 [Lentisphaerota bacterium]
MSRENEKLNTEKPACGPGCGCHAQGPSSRIRWVAGVIVLAAAGVLVARAMIKEPTASTGKGAEGFATMLPAEQQLSSEGQLSAPATEADRTAKEIAAISDLNMVAADSDAVFVLIPGKDSASEKPPMTEIQAAVRTLETQGRKIGIFTLKTDSPDYAQVSLQVTAPGVLAMVKGRGMSAVSGEITETKLMQAFVGASSAGGCGAGSSCGPSTAGCGPRK